MTIAKRPARNQVNPVQEDAAEAFIGAAPDGNASAMKPAVQPKKPRLMSGKKPQISLAIDEEKLDALDALLVGTGISRAAAINIAIGQLLERGVVFGGK